MPPFSLPPDYPRIRRVQSFHELRTTPFANGVNALCWERTLSGDYAEVVAHLGAGDDAGEGIMTLEDERLRALALSAAGRQAVAQMLEDQRLLREHDLAPVLNCIHGYPRDEAAAAVKTDVFSYHADSAPFAAETWLCTYYGPSSEGLRNEDALRRIDVPETRAALLREFGGADDESFREFLRENCYDLHYAPMPDAEPFSFGLGNLWRICVDYPDSPVPPCIHRAPTTRPGDPPRLLLIS